MKIPALTVAILALSGCASSGTKIDLTQLTEMRTGQTTVDDVVRRFGRPNFLSKNWDGTQTAAYASSEGRSDASMALPAMGAVVGGTDFTVDTVTFYFDAKGMLTNYRTTHAAGRPAQASSITVSPVVPQGPVQTDTSKPVRTQPAMTTNQGASEALSLPSWLPSSSVRDPNRY